MLRPPRLTVVSPSRRTRTRSGFSLVELSIVVAILSVVSTFGLEAAASFINRTNGQVTRDKMAIVDEAIRNYFRVYGRLPCPAVRTTAPTTNTYGLEDCTITAITAASVPAGSNTGGGILYGTVPFRNLNIPMNVALDGWNNKINYVVTKNLTVAGTGTGSSNNFGDTTNGKGGIEIRAGILEQPCSSAKCQVVGNPSSTTGAAYIIFSAGANQHGAYSAQGVLRAACVGSLDGTKVDSQNCINADSTTITVTGNVTAAIPRNVFFDGRFNNGLATSYYFDDYVTWRPRSQL